MSLDILLFAVIAAVIVARLRSILGTRHGDERQRGNPFDQSRQAHDDKADVVTPLHNRPMEGSAAHTVVIDDALLKGDNPEETRQGLQHIIESDHSFDLQVFMQGARGAFKMITDAFAKGDRETLEPLLSEELYSSFDQAISAREENDYEADYELHRIKDARIIDARLGGVMAYITVDFDVEQTSILKDKNGKTVEGDNDRITETHDIWTFSRDIRSDDPNWELVATRIGDG